MEKKNKKAFDLLIHVDQYISATIFIIIMVLLTLQVLSRYILGKSFTWTEELSILLFVWMAYTGSSSAITERRMIRIDALLNVVPFKVKKIMLIASDIVFFAFNIYFIFPFCKLIKSLGNSVTPIMGIPKAIIYYLLPVILVFTCFKIVLNIIRLIHEDEKHLGVSKPTIDLTAIEEEYKSSHRENVGGEE